MQTVATKTYFAQFLSSGSLFAAGIFVPIVLDKKMNATPLEIGFVVTGYATALFIASVIIGRAADMNGRRKFLRIGFALASIATIMQIFASNTILLLLVRIFLGAAAGMIQSVLVAYFIYETQGKVGKFSSLGALGWGCGSFIAGLIGDYYFVFIFSAGLMIIAGITIFTLPATQEQKYDVPLFPTRVLKQNAAVYFSVLIRHIGANFIWVTYPIFLMDVLGADAFWVGMIYMVNAMGQFFVMSRIDPFRSTHLIKAGFILSAFTFLGFSMTMTVIEIIPLQILLAFAWSSLYVGSLKFVTERNPEKATSMGWLQGMISIAGIIGPAIGGILDETVGYRTTMLIAMGLSIIGLAVFLLARRKEPAAILTS